MAHFNIRYAKATVDAYGTLLGSFPDYEIRISMLLGEPTEMNRKMIVITFVHELLHIIHANWSHPKIYREEYRLANISGHYDVKIASQNGYLRQLKHLAELS